MILIYFICFLDFLSLGILMPVAPVHLVSLGASRLLIGGLTSLNALLQLTTGPLVGSWSDTKGRKALLIQCLFLVLTSNLLLLFTSSLFIYIVSRIIIGLTGHVQILLRAIVASTVPKSEQNETFAKMGAAIGLSLVVGPLLGGVLNSTENGMFKIAVLLNIFTVINLSASFFIPDTKIVKQGKHSKEKPILTELTHAFTNLIQVDWNTFWDLFLFRFLRESGYSAFFTTFGVVLMDHLGASQSEMGLTISLFSITMIATNLSMGKIKEKFYADDSSGYRRNLHGFIGLTAVFALLYLYTGFYLYIAIMLAMGVLGAVLDATWMEMLVDRTSDSNKGTITGSFESIMQMANLVTPMIATYVEQNYGYHKTFLISIMFLTSGILVGSYRQRVYQQSVKRD